MQEYPTPLVAFTVPSCPVEDRAQIVSFHLLNETHTLVLLTLGGDIGVIPIDDDSLGPVRSSFPSR